MTVIQVLVFSIHAQQCENETEIRLNGRCDEIYCNTDDECTKHQGYCDSINKGKAACYGGVTCRCGWGGKSATTIVTPGGTGTSCNYQLRDDSKCNQGMECLPDGTCGVRSTTCAYKYEPCVPNSKDCCDKGNYFCHQRNGDTSFTCMREAFIKESCATGIPCELHSQCINGICSLRPEDDCDFEDAVRPTGTQCNDAPISTGKNKMCT